MWPRRVPLIALLVVACASSRSPERALEPLLAAAHARAPGGTIVVEHHGRIIVDHAYGFADLELGAPVTPDSVFAIGSISKQFGAAAIMQLVAAGKLDLDDPLARFDASFPRADRIRIRDLLQHTSGIADFEYDGVWPSTMAVERTTAEVIATFRDLPPMFEPGTAWSYSSSNYVLLGAIIEQVSGQRLATYLQANVFAPAGLQHTRFCDADQLIPHRAKGYAKRDDAFIPAAPAILTQFGLAGGLCATARDLLRWQHALEDGRVVSAAAYQQMTTPARLADGTLTGYGYGLFIGVVAGHPVVAHSGAVSGFAAMLSHYVDDDLRIVALINTRDASTPAYAMASHVLGFGHAVAVPMPAGPDLAAFAAVVPFAPGEFRFAVQDGRLSYAYAERGTVKGQWTPLVYVGDATFEEADRWLRIRYELIGGVVTGVVVNAGETTLRARIGPR